MSWFFASSETFQNGNSETINNAPINLDVVSNPTMTSSQPEGTTLVLYAISFLVDAIATTLYLHYPSEAARDADYALLLVQIALPVTNKAGWHTAANFVNGSSESIVNENLNLDIVSTYRKTRHKPPFTSEILYAIALVIANKNKPEHLYYTNEAARDADYIVIQNKIAAIGTATSSFVLTPNYALIASQNSGGWVSRNLGIGANKSCQIKIVREGSGDTLCYVGAREIGSAEPYHVMDIWAKWYKIIKTDASGNIETFATSYTNFYLTHILSIE